MQFGNVNRLLYFKHAAPPDDVSILALEQFQQDYGFEPDGVNFYVGISAAAHQALEQEGGTGLNATHRAFFESLMQSVLASPDQGKQLILSLEPLEAGDPFTFVDNNLDWVRSIASQVAGYQERADAAGKGLGVLVRYASEMNDRGNKTYGHRPDEFRQSFAAVRRAFGEVAPRVHFSFSPALRSDIDESELAAYWPGDGLVDVLGGTWYVGAQGDFDAATATLRKYVLHRLDRSLPFAISEIAGTCSQGNDAMLRMMFRELNALADPHQVQFKYVSLFLDSRWGRDARLDFLTQ